MFHDFIFNYSMSMIALGLASIHDKSLNLPYLSAILILVLMDIRDSYYHNQERKKNGIEFQHQALQKLLIIKCFLSILGKAFIVVRYFYQFKLVFTLLIPFLMMLIRIKVYFTNTSQDNDYRALLQFVYTHQRIKHSVVIAGCVLMCCTMISIKIDELQDWSWRGAFWWYWVILSLMIGLQITLVLILFGKVLDLIRFEANLIYQVKTLVWTNYWNAGLMIVSFIWQQRTLVYLNGQKPNFFGFHITLTCILGIFLLISWTWRKNIINFLTDLLNDQPHSLAEVPLDMSSPVSILNQGQKVGLNLKSPRKSMKSVPRVLKRISSSYFGVVSPISKAQPFRDRRIGTHQKRSRRSEQPHLTPNTIEIGSVAESSLVTNTRQPNQEDTNSKNSTHKPMMIQQNGTYNDCETPSEVQKQGPIQEKTGKTNLLKDSSETQSINSECLVCFQNQADCVIMDCGHGGLCLSCCLDIQKRNNQCHLCRKIINQIVQIDLGSLNKPYYTVIQKFK